MSLDQYNLKLRRVPLAKDDRFSKYTPEAGEPFWRINKYYIAVGDGVNPGGYALASKNWVHNAIRYVEITGSVKGLEAS